LGRPSPREARDAFFCNADPCVSPVPQDPFAVYRATLLHPLSRPLYLRTCLSWRRRMLQRHHPFCMSLEDLPLLEPLPTYISGSGVPVRASSPVPPLLPRTPSPASPLRRRALVSPTCCCRHRRRSPTQRTLRTVGICPPAWRSLCRHQCVSAGCDF
jgi:hypothetical protein